MRVLILDLDTLRPDHLGCYGYHRNTSPNLDRIAAEGVRFDNYYCSDAPCLPSRAAWVTGRFGIHTGVVGHGGTAADLRLLGTDRGFRDRLDRESFWSIFRRKGMHTCSISPFAERHGAYWFLSGMNEVHNTGQGGGESAERITPVVLDWLERNAAKDDWLLHVNYWDPHTPYRAPAEFGNPFADDPLPGWLTAEVLEKHRNMVGPHCAREIAMYNNATNPRHPRQPGELKDMSDLRRMIDGYDCGIRYLDDHIGKLLAALEKQGVLDELVILVTSDHGENQGELGIYGEHATADRITCRIPMIVRWPGVAKAGHVDAGLHYNLDLAPTLAELFAQAPAPRWDGQSYAPALRGESAGRDVLFLSQNCHVCQRGVRFGSWMYVRTYHDGYHLFDREMLFDIERDPHEQYNLATERRDICAQAAARLLDWHDEMMATQLDGYTVDPMRTVLAEGGPEHARGRLRKYCEYLEQTGRGWAIEELKKRHPREFA
ncbi:MAG TPA: sulfatase [Phycisphaerales bacterium]|nr:sulfatase [Phycisphaerales bacterium]